MAKSQIALITVNKGLNRIIIIWQNLRKKRYVLKKGMF